jgi:hypothetical protein
VDRVLGRGLACGDGHSGAEAAGIDLRESRLLFIATLAQFFEQVQGGVDLGHKALNFFAFMRAGILLQPFEQLLLSRKEVGKGCHRVIKLAAMSVDDPNRDSDPRKLQAMRATRRQQHRDGA